MIKCSVALWVHHFDIWHCFSRSENRKCCEIKEYQELLIPCHFVSHKFRTSIDDKLVKLCYLGMHDKTKNISRELFFFLVQSQDDKIRCHLSIDTRC